MEGWVCPTCQHVYAPAVTECSRCPAQFVTGITTTLHPQPGIVTPGFEMRCLCCQGQSTAACPVHRYPTSFTTGTS